MKVIWRVFALDLLLLAAAVCVLASPATAQSVADLFTASSQAADRAAAVATSTDGVLKLALWAVILMILLTSSMVAYLLRWVSQISRSLDRLSARPCLVRREELEGYLRRLQAEDLSVKS